MEGRSVLADAIATVVTCVVFGFFFGLGLRLAGLQ